MTAQIPVREGKTCLSPSVFAQDFLFSQKQPFFTVFQGDGDVAVLRFGEEHFTAGGAVFQVRGQLCPENGVFARVFQPHALPDTGGGGVPAAEPLANPGLFAPGLCRVGPVDGLYGQAVFPILHQLCDIQRKGHMTAGVFACGPVIDPHPGLIVHRAEMEQQTAGQVFLRNGKRPAVPDFLVVIGFANAAFFRLIAEGDGDFPVKYRPVKGKRPHAVQTFPVFPDKVGAGETAAVVDGENRGTGFHNKLLSPGESRD